MSVAINELKAIQATAIWQAITVLKTDLHYAEGGRTSTPYGYQRCYAEGDGCE